MATKETLEVREADCETIGDLTDLATEAMRAPADIPYGKRLLEKAEMRCQLPGDYIRVAEAAVFAGRREHAADLYRQAEAACRESRELAALAHSLATVFGDRERAGLLLQQATESASDLSDLLVIARHPARDPGDEALVRTLLGRMEALAKSLGAHRRLAGAVLNDLGDAAAARTLYEKAVRYCDDAGSTLSYAQGLVELFQDQAAARRALEDAETDCRFIGDYVVLAEGHQRLFGGGEKVQELMEQAAAYAMTGAEHMQLAEGLWRLLHDADAAAEAYERAIPDITATDELLALARTVATGLGNRELARKVCAKAEGRLSTAPDYVRLAQALSDCVGGVREAARLYARAEDRLAGASDLVTLAGGVLRHLGDRPHAAKLYLKALEKTEGFARLLTLVDAVQEGLGDPDLVRRVLEKATGAAATTEASLQVAERALTLLQDRAFAGRALEAAEEHVTNLSEMRAVTAAVKILLPDDAQRRARLEAKLAKREENQARYAEFQRREERVKSFAQLLRLVDAAMDELQDPSYARKLLSGAEARLQGTPFDLNKYRELVLSIDRHLSDETWLQSLLDHCAAQCQHFAQLRTLGRVAARELSNPAFGQALVRRYYEQSEGSIRDRPGASVYDFTKLASAVWEDLGDAQWSRRLLARAQESAPDFLGLSYIGCLLRDLGDREAASRHFLMAARACSNASQYVQLINRLRASGVELEELHRIYATGEDTLKSPWDRLRWAEGIHDMLGDRAWAAEIYQRIATEFTSESEQAVFELSRRTRLGKPFYGDGS